MTISVKFSVDVNGWPRYHMPYKNCRKLQPFNAKSVSNKLRELHYMLYAEIKPSLLFITESWLTENLPAGCLDPESCFYVMLCDRKIGSRGGGVCALVHRSLHVEIHVADSYRELELLCFDLSYGSKKLRFLCVYRPPHYDINARLYLDSLLTCIASYYDGNYTNVIVGDLNCPRIDWGTHSYAANYVNAGILTFVVESGLYQFVDFPTCGCNLLDVILADDPFIISSVTAGSPFGNSDHLSIKFVLNVESSNNASDAITNSSNIQCNWYKADFESMRGYLNTVDWHNMLHYNPSALTFWRSFVDTLWSVVAMFVPKTANRFRIPFVVVIRHIAGTGNGQEA